VALVLGLLHVWAHRHSVNPDSISYIEIAQSAREAGWKSYVNGYWSPFTLFVEHGLRIFEPGPLCESTVVTFANFAIYLANLACFEWFLRELILLRDASNRPVERGFPISSRTLWICGYVFFLWAGQFWVTPGWVTPDLCVAGLGYLATAALIRIHRGQASWATFVFFGAVLGLGYLAKAPMFPLAFVFLAVVSGREFGQASLDPCRSFGTRLFYNCRAFAISLSRAKGRMTFGDSGRITMPSL